MHCYYRCHGLPKDIAAQIIKQKGDYLLALKGNQGQLHYEVKSFFEIAKEANFKNITYDSYEDIDTGHGRIETRKAYLIDANVYQKQLPSAKNWKKLNSIVMIDSAREGRDFKTPDRRLYMTSVHESAEKILNASCKHWAVENALHWTLYVTFREDESRIRKDASPENYAIFRHIALNIIRNNTSIDASVKRKKHMAALDDKVRTKLIQDMFKI